LDEDGKTQYYAEALNGNAFVLGETAKVLELFPEPFTVSIPYNIPLTGPFATGPVIEEEEEGEL
ncbi:MAG: hypothetical protein J5674_02450, partial [Candidatus Methanomethylophilaceae archaeon]|nr:hypothetical protein [Candidatus Methanomethylophilaceae archaeon]